MGKDETVNKGSITFSPDYGVPTGSVPRGPWGPMMHEEPTKEQIAIHNQNATLANATQIGGEHYQTKAIQPWDYVAANNLGYFEGTAIKYLTRWKDKGGVDDLKKAVHFIEKLIELQA